MSAQASTLLVAGAETSSTALCRILHLLALRPSVQDTLRHEINEALPYDRNGMGALEYEKLITLPFLDAVCKETLRVFAPAPLRNRRLVILVPPSTIPLLTKHAWH